MIDLEEPTQWSMPDGFTSASDSSRASSRELGRRAKQLGARCRTGPWDGLSIRPASTNIDKTLTSTDDPGSTLDDFARLQEPAEADAHPSIPAVSFFSAWRFPRTGPVIHEEFTVILPLPADMNGSSEAPLVAGGRMRAERTLPDEPATNPS